MATWKTIVRLQQERHKDCETREVYFDEITGMRTFMCNAHREILYKYPVRVEFQYEDGSVKTSPALGGRM